MNWIIILLTSINQSIIQIASVCYIMYIFSCIICGICCLLYILKMFLLRKRTVLKNFRRDLRNVLNCVQFVKIPKSAIKDLWFKYELELFSNVNFFLCILFITISDRTMHRPGRYWWWIVHNFCFQILYSISIKSIYLSIYHTCIIRSMLILINFNAMQTYNATKWIYTLWECRL